MTTREYMAAKLREFRLAKKMSVTEVGEAISKSGKTISAWEVGRGQPDADKLVQLCELYDVRISDFFDDTASVVTATELSPTEKRLIDSYRTLNDDGQARVNEYATLIAQSGDYERE